MEKYGRTGDECGWGEWKHLEKKLEEWASEKGWIKKWASEKLGEWNWASEILVDEWKFHSPRGSFTHRL